MNLTPAMIQFYELKEQNSDCILFFRMGDFYEMFDEDALIANKVLGIAVTSRNKNAIKPTPLAGIPFHAKEKYLPLLINAGYKVAIAEQISDPNLKGIVKREVVRVVTPSTISLEGDNYNTDESSIISIVKENDIYGLSILDLGQNNWKTCEFNSIEDLVGELYKISPKEVVLEKNLFNNNELKTTLEKKYSLNIYFFEAKEKPYNKLLNHFSTTSLEGFGIEKYKVAQKASSLIVEYIENNQKSSIKFLDKICLLDMNSYLSIDESTIKNLDLVYNFATNSTKNGSLLGVLDKTKTSMGSIKMRESILEPLNNYEKIKERQNFISEFLKDKILLDNTRKHLGNISNINGILNRIYLNRASPKDLINLKNSLKSILNVFDLINKSDSRILKKIIKK